MTKPSRPYELPRKLVSVIFEMNLDSKLFERDIYDYMDWLGDIGGIYSALFIIGAFFVSLLQYEPVYQLLIQNLFMIPSSPEEQQKLSLKKTHNHTSSVNREADQN